MNLEFRTNLGRRVVVMAGTNLGSLREWLAEIKLTALKAREQPADALLLDFRLHGFMPSEREAGTIISALQVLCGPRTPPVAILANPGAQFGVARMMCTLGELAGCRTAAFRDEMAAWTWLQARLDVSPPEDSSPEPGVRASA